MEEAHHRTKGKIKGRGGGVGAGLRILIRENIGILWLLLDTAWLGGVRDRTGRYIHLYKKIMR